MKHQASPQVGISGIYAGEDVNFWTNSYFVATVGGAPLKIVKDYIENEFSLVCSFTVNSDIVLPRSV